MIEPGALSEVPEALQRLVRYILRGFYGNEHVIVAEMLMKHPCIKEDDLLDRLCFERKQLRSIINSLKVDHFIKTRLRVETDAEGKTTKHNYYFVCYNVFVNVVKYKLDHMRRKIDTEERDMANRASFVCTECGKQFTDLEVGQLVDMVTGRLICTFCEAEVTDDPTGEETGGQSSDGNKASDKRTLMIKFNDQIKQIFDLLRDVEKVKLSASILEPEPLELKPVRSGGHGGGSKTGEEKWSGEVTRYRGIDLNSHITIATGDGAEESGASRVKPKETPVWMTHSTVDGSSVGGLAHDIGLASRDSSSSSSGLTTSNQRGPSAQDVMKTLLSHEKHSGPAHHGPASFSIGGPGQNNASSSSDSDDDDDDDDDDSARRNRQTSNPLSFVGMFGGAIDAPRVAEPEHMDDDDDAVAMVTVGGVRYQYQDVTSDLVARMNQEEKQEYIRIGQELYQDYYD